MHVAFAARLKPVSLIPTEVPATSAPPALLVSVPPQLLETVPCHTTFAGNVSMKAMPFVVVALLVTLKVIVAMRFTPTGSGAEIMVSCGEPGAVTV